MRLVATVIVAALIVCGCAKKEDAGAFAYSENAEKAANQFMAYEHSLSLDTEEGNVKTVLAKAEALCRNDQVNSCTVLDSNLSSGPQVAAKISLRAKPDGVRAIMKAISANGEVISQSTHAEDLAKPIADSAKQLEMLKDYQRKLLDLNAKARTDIDSLIKISKELASVQSEIESAAGENAHLMQRVNTEILNINIDSRRKGSFWKPIVSAASEFSASLASGISSAITGVAYLLPWLLVILGVGWVGRWIWRRFKKPSRSKE
ncbi:DUF4349 domain-containing protein [Paraherbaspirillum soli]|uniref:DUF4349 domain-containing protein n=1 Tax=Paraherbaspirillum soli TaxID=631222 RepID=A0ABW0MB90_9BURK